MQKVSKNVKLLMSFVKYCNDHPDLRFWQALRNWSGWAFIYACNEPSGEGESYDTFFWEHRSG